jgi:hypothetical protein
MKNENPTFGNVLLPADLLDEIIKYIEESEQAFEGEWSSGRTLKELIKDNCMPELYDKLIALKKHNTPTEENNVLPN